MPNRILRDSIRTSRSLANLNGDEFRHFTLLIAIADDFGRFDATPQVIKGFCYPLFDGKVSSEDVDEWTNRLAATDVEIIQLYEVGSKLIGQFINWDKYQQRRAKRSKFPQPPEDVSSCTQTLADVSNSIPTQTDALVNEESRNEESKTRDEEIVVVVEETETEQDETTTTTTKSKFLQNLETAFGETIGPPRRIVQKEMLELAENMPNAPPEWPQEAVAEAVRAGEKSLNWRYVKAILQAWQTGPPGRTNRRNGRQSLVDSGIGPRERARIEEMRQEHAQASAREPPEEPE